MTSFDHFWLLVDPTNTYPQQKDFCQRIWNGLSLQRQRIIYASIRNKKKEGEKVHPNPKFALEDNINAEPPFLSGFEQDEETKNGTTLVQVRYNNKFLICTRQTMTDFGLEFVRDW